MAESAGTWAGSVLDLAPDGIIVVDNEGSIVYVNGRAGELFAYDPEELLGKPIEVLIPERIRKVHQKQAEEYCNNPRVRPMGIGTKHPGLRSDGTEFKAEIALGPMWKDGELTVMAVIRDITERP